MIRSSSSISASAGRLVLLLPMQADHINSTHSIEGASSSPPPPSLRSLLALSLIDILLARCSLLGACPLSHRPDSEQTVFHNTRKENIKNPKYLVFLEIQILSHLPAPKLLQSPPQPGFAGYVSPNSVSHPSTRRPQPAPHPRSDPQPRSLRSPSTSESSFLLLSLSLSQPTQTPPHTVQYNIYSVRPLDFPASLARTHARISHFASQ